jgi:hypothetical protein
MNDELLLNDLNDHLAKIDALIAEYQRDLKDLEAQVEQELQSVTVQQSA